MNGMEFSLGKALYLAWKATIHVGMEIWSKIQGFDRRPNPIATLQAIFNSIWTKEGIFATERSPPIWKLRPPEEFLPYHLAHNIKPSTTSPIPIRPKLSQDSLANQDEQPTLDDAINQRFQSVHEELNKR